MMRLGLHKSMLRLVVLLGILVINSCQSRNHEDKMPVTTHSETANVYYLNGLEAGEKANMTQAIDDFGKAIEEDQDFFMAYCQNAAYYLYFNKVEKFKENAELAVQCHSNLSKAEEVLKKALVELLVDPSADVSKYGKELVEQYPHDVKAYMYLALFQLIPGNVAGAISTYQKAAEIEPESPTIYNMMGYAFMQGKQFTKAGKSFQTAITLSPENAHLYESKGDYFMAIKDFDSAASSYEKAIGIDSLLNSAREKAILAHAFSAEN